MIEAFGSIEAIENAPRSDVKAVNGIGETTVNRIGIWDEHGEPVAKLKRNPCPVCGETFDERISGEYDVERTINIAEPTDVCIKVNHPQASGLGASPPTVTNLSFFEERIPPFTAGVNPTTPPQPMFNSNTDI